ncbi:MAG: hypothetical protein PUP93_26375 [Rhizonema sp. NSF051]|nr:hypothetical protein [Rhizonema sp. NSF051]
MKRLAVFMAHRSDLESINGYYNSSKGMRDRTLGWLTLHWNVLVVQHLPMFSDRL